MVIRIGFKRHRREIRFLADSERSRSLGQYGRFRLFGEFKFEETGDPVFDSQFCSGGTCLGALGLEVPFFISTYTFLPPTIPLLGSSYFARRLVRVPQKI